MRFLILLCLFLSACGGGDPEDFADEPEPLRAAYSSPVKIIHFGDSTQYGAHTGTSAPLRVQIIADRLGVPIEVQNMGVSASYAEQLLYGTGAKFQTVPFDQVLQAYPDARIVTFRYGINDRRKYDENEFRERMETLISMVEESGRIAIIETPSPTERGTRAIERNVEQLRLLAQSHPNAVLCDHWKHGEDYGWENSDGIHPTARAYRLYQGRVLFRCVRRAMRKLEG